MLAQEFYVTLGKAIRGFRVADRVTQADLARRVGITPRTLQRIEAARSHCSVHQLVKIAEALDLSLDFDLFPVTTAERKSA